MGWKSGCCCCLLNLAEVIHLSPYNARREQRVAWHHLHLNISHLHATHTGNKRQHTNKRNNAAAVSPVAAAAALLIPPPLLLLLLAVITRRRLKALAEVD